MRTVDLTAGEREARPMSAQPQPRQTRRRSDQPRCCMCNRFVSMKTAQRHVDRGDYGTVYSVEFECPRGTGCHVGDGERGEPFIAGGHGWDSDEYGLVG